jgi:methionine-rich copper-binding protein CopC
VLYWRHFSRMLVEGSTVRRGNKKALKIHVLSCGVFGLACALALVQSFWAHAILLEATPAKNAIVSGSPLSVELRFNCRIDGKRSRLSLILPNQALRLLVIQPQISPDKLSAQDKGFEPGSYRLRWQVLASDGHITRGEIPFLIK